jgi:DNA polymerase
MPASSRHIDYIARFKRHIEDRLLWRPDSSGGRERLDGEKHALEAECAACMLCALAGHRRRVVCGAGVAPSQVMVLLPAPSAEDEDAGAPCVGETGAFLEKMLVAISLSRASVYMTPLVKCRPSEDRPPRPEELSACRGYLEREIAMVRPRALLALGLDKATLAEVGSSTARLFAIGHPADLMRRPEGKREAWKRLQELRAFLDAG